MEHALAQKPRMHYKKADQCLKTASKCCCCLQTLTRQSWGSEEHHMCVADIAPDTAVAISLQVEGQCHSSSA